MQIKITKEMVSKIKKYQTDNILLLYELIQAMGISRPTFYTIIKLKKVSLITIRKIEKNLNINLLNK